MLPLFDMTVLFLNLKALTAHCLNAPISLRLCASEKQVVPEAQTILVL